MSNRSRIPSAAFSSLYPFVNKYTKCHFSARLVFCNCKHCCEDPALFITHESPNGLQDFLKSPN